MEKYKLPLSKRQRDRLLINCTKCAHGVMFNVSSKLALSLGVLELECDYCGHHFSKKVSEGK